MASGRVPPEAVAYQPAAVQLVSEAQEMPSSTPHGQAGAAREPAPPARQTGPGHRLRRNFCIRLVNGYDFGAALYG